MIHDTLASTERMRFIDLALSVGALRFGSFVTKAGRQSPYFFNSGAFATGRALKQLAAFYADLINHSKLEFDTLFGPAYKGIPLATAIALALTEHGMDKQIVFNRKESKDHGEGGNIIGTGLDRRVLLIDDVISAGLSSHEALNYVKHAQGQCVGMVIALDRCERGQDSAQSAAMQLNDAGISVYAIANIFDVLSYCQRTRALQCWLASLEDYLDHYGVNTP